MLAAIYRLVQEGLSNAVRHGHPRRIEISVEPAKAAGDGPEEVIVQIADDGIGLATSGMPDWASRECMSVWKV